MDAECWTQHTVNRAIKGEDRTPLLVGENVESKPLSWLKTPSYLPKLMREKHVSMSYLNCVTLSGKPCLTNVISYYFLHVTLKLCDK